MEPEPFQPDAGVIAPEIPWYRTPFFGRLLVFGVPPLGVALIWTDSRRSVAGKLLATVALALFCIPYLLFLAWLVVFLNLGEFEWKGGFGPSLVTRKTEPDYNALERSRSQQQEQADTAFSRAPNLRSYWTDFRGPRRDGLYEEQPILLDWPESGPRVLWRQPVGGGYASFVVSAGMAFTIEQRREEETVAAYDIETGREIWRHAYPAMFSEWMGGDGPRATPVLAGEVLYSLGATGELLCFGAPSGTLLWRKNILEDNQSGNLRYGMAASPLVIGNELITLTGDASPGKSVVAYDRLNGRRLWSALDDRQSYTSPMLVELAGERQILIVTASRLVGLALDGSKVLWEFPWSVQYENAIATPLVVGTNQVLISAGYGTGAALVQIGRTGDAFSAWPVWRNRNLKTKFNPAVLWQGHAYGLDEGVLACVNVTTGERRWRDGRYGYGQLLLASGHLIVLGGEGELALVKAVPERWEELRRVRVLRGKTWNVPALSGGYLLVRNSAEMACLDLRSRRGVND